MSAQAAPLEAASAPSGRALAFFALFATALVTLRPFENLSAADYDDLGQGRDVPTYLAFALLAAFMTSLIWRSEAPALRALALKPYFALLGVIGLAALHAPDPATAIKRAVLVALVAFCAAGASLLPAGRRELAGWLAVAAALVIALSYFGVLFLPELSIHQGADTVEAELAGDWRGVYAHKNIASPVFGMLAFIGIFVARAGKRIEGAAIASAALVFLAFTGGKTSSALWVPAMGLSLLPYSRLWALAAAMPFLAINGFGALAQAAPALAKFAKSLPFDSTFTGRTDIWALAVQKIAEHPLTGWGFQSFWANSDLRYNSENGWVGDAANAHNGYVDALLSMGVVGLVLTLWCFGVQPLRDLAAATRRGADPALTALFTQIWIYGLWVSCLESFLFNRADPVFFLFLFAVFGLRFLACFRTLP